jgi:hypothetical protein
MRRRCSSVFRPEIFRFSGEPISRSACRSCAWALWLTSIHNPDGRLLAESSASRVPQREHIWLPLDGQASAPPIALVTDAGSADPRLHYLPADHLGTPVAMTSAAKRVLVSLDTCS